MKIVSKWILLTLDPDPVRPFPMGAAESTHVPAGTSQPDH